MLHINDQESLFYKIVIAKLHKEFDFYSLFFVTLKQVFISIILGDSS
jgi:hypothetical protein